MVQQGQEDEVLPQLVDLELLRIGIRLQGVEVKLKGFSKTLASVEVLELIGEEGRGD